jgi:hypothetical protein
MTASRIVAALAALAVGCGVTVVGAVVADDEAPSRVETQESDDSSEAPQDNELRQDDVDDTDSPGTNVSEATPPSPASTVPLDATPLPSPPSTATPLPDDPPPATNNELDQGNLDGVKCVETISVVYSDGRRADYVVVETLEASSFVVLDADGEFEVSARDPDVEELVLVSRNVRFFQGAAINFLDVCSDLGGDEGGLGDAIESMRADPNTRHTPDIDQNGAL